MAYFGHAFSQAECLWARGILPAGLCPPMNQPQDTAQTWASPNFDAMLATAQAFYPDGSGGKVALVAGLVSPAHPAPTRTGKVIIAASLRGASLWCQRSVAAARAT